LMNGTPEQINLPANLRNIEQNFLIGPANRPYYDPSHVAQAHAFDGIGLRPYAPVHLRKDGVADHQFSWLRRTRMGGDDWSLPDVPLNEETESYRIQIKVEGQLKREVMVGSSVWDYTVAMRAVDGISGPYAVEVAQLSARFGAGLAARTVVVV
jgi:hypothetical protein